MTGTSTNVNVESSRAKGGSARASGSTVIVISPATSWPLPSLTVYENLAVAGPSASVSGVGENWISSRLNTAAWPIRFSGWVTDTTVSGSPSGSTSLAVTSRITDSPTTTLSASAVTIGGRLGSMSSITETSTDVRTTCPRPSSTSYSNGTNGAAPARATIINWFPATSTSSPGPRGSTTLKVIASPSGSESLTSTGSGVGTLRRNRTASGRATGGRFGSPGRATSTRTSTSSPTASSASTGR